MVKKEENGSEIKTICFNRFKENKIPIEKTVITEKELIKLGLVEDDEGELNLLEVLNANPESCNPCEYGKKRGLTNRKS